MKRILCLFAALLAAAAFARAQETAPAREKNAPPAPLSRFSLGAHLSYWNAKDLDDLDLDGAFGLGLVGQCRLHELLAIELRMSGYAAGASDDTFVPGEGWYDTDTTVVAAPFEAGLVAFLPLGGTFSLYGGPGAGFYFFDGEFRSQQGPLEIKHDLDLDDVAGVYLLAGARAQLARNVALFLEGKYTWVETSLEQDIVAFAGRGEARIPDSGQDIDFSGLSVEAGMLFTF